METLNLLYGLLCSLMICTGPGLVRLDGGNKNNQHRSDLPENFYVETYCTEHRPENTF